VNVIVEREKGPLQELEARIVTLRSRGSATSEDVRVLEGKYVELLRDLFGNLTPWERVNMARHPKRPIGSDYVAALDHFDELHGDRHFRDDHALAGGLAKLRGRRVVVLAQQKGRDTKENIRRNFGMVAPEGYRKAKRLMELASRFNLPIVTFVDTSGADPGIASEEHAQAEAIAACLMTLAKARVPVVATVIGEGGSGGALALALANTTIMAENAVYSVASPEGCAAILWGDAARAPEAAERLKLTSADLAGFGIVDRIVEEPLGGAHRDAAGYVNNVLDAIDEELRALESGSADELRESRYRKFRRIGAWERETQTLVATAALP
jgi:acetyl-CoA carboxylase carboxyl transferase subunit alpha